MWVSQSYLSNLRADGSVMAYFLYESYRDDHAEVEALVLPKLAKVASSFGDKAHVFVPSKDDRASIEREFNDWLADNNYGKIDLPGILILEKTMGEKARGKRCLYLSFAPLLKDPSLAESVIQKVKKMMLDVAAEPSTDARPGGFLDNLQLKPSLWGVGYDLKPHLIRLFSGKSSPRR